MNVISTFAQMSARPGLRPLAPDAPLTTAREIARALSFSHFGVCKRAKREGWREALPGERVYQVQALPADVRTVVLNHRETELAEQAIDRLQPRLTAYKYRDQELTAKSFTAAELAVADERMDFVIAVRLTKRRGGGSDEAAVQKVRDDVELAAARFGSVLYPLLTRERLTVRNYVQWAHRLVPWQRDPLDRSCAYVLADLYRLAAAYHKATILDRLELSEKEITAIQYLILETDSVPIALEMYARDTRCRDLVREAIQRFTETGNIPDSLRRAIYVPDEVKKAFRDKRGARRMFCQYRGKFYINRLGQKVELLPGDLWEADDMSCNQPWFVEWPYGGDPCSERHGVRVGRGQLLAMRDVISGRWLSFTLIMRFRDSYRSTDIWRWLGRTSRDVGLPRVGYRFERNVWEAKMIKGVKLFPDDGTHELRFGGIEDLGVNLVHSYSSTGKAFIEQGFDMLQKVLGPAGVQVGRYPSEFAEATRKLQACLDGRLDPRAAGFLHMDELVERIAAAMAFLNTRKINGRIQNGIPDEQWARHVTAERPLPPLAADKEWVFLPERRELTVRNGLITATHAETGTIYPFEITPLVDRGICEGYRVIARFDPIEPQLGAWLFNNETRACNVNGWKIGQHIGVAPLLELAPQLDLCESSANQCDRRKAYANAFREAYCALDVFGRCKASAVEVRDGRGNLARVETGVRLPVLPESAPLVPPGFEVRRQVESTRTAGRNALQNVVASVDEAQEWRYLRDVRENQPRQADGAGDGPAESIDRIAVATDAGDRQQSPALARDMATPDHARTSGEADLLTLAEVAQRLHISTRTLWRILDSDKSFPKPLPIGRSKRWRRTDIQNYLAQPTL